MRCIIYRQDDVCSNQAVRVRLVGIRVVRFDVLPQDPRGSAYEKDGRLPSIILINRCLDWHRSGEEPDESGSGGVIYAHRYQHQVPI